MKGNGKQNCTDWSTIVGEPVRVRIKGRIKATYGERIVAPLSNYNTVTLYAKKPTKGVKVFYLKLTKEELERLAFSVNENVAVEGILNCVDGKRIVTNVKRSSEEF